MVRLFSINPDYELELNKEWILLVPEFADIFKADKGSKGDYRGDRKLLARKQLGLIYLLEDFQSPLRDERAGYYEIDKKTNKTKFHPGPKDLQAVKMLGLDETELNEPMIIAARLKYKELLASTARSLKTFNAAKKGLDHLDDYLYTINFSEKDKMGRLVNSPKEFTETLRKLNEGYQALAEFEENVKKELSNEMAIRGDIEIGEDEANFSDLPEWNEKSKNRINLEEAIKKEMKQQSVPITVTEEEDDNDN